MKKYLILVFTYVLLSCTKDNDGDSHPDPGELLPEYVVQKITYTPAAGLAHATVYKYDVKARVISSEYYQPANATSWSRQTSFTYDDNGRMIKTRSVLASSTATTDVLFEYNDAGQLIQRQNFLNDAPSGTSEFEYNGNVVVENYAGLVQYTYTFDADTNITKKVAVFTHTPEQNYTEEWIGFDDKPMLTFMPVEAGHIRSRNNFLGRKLTFEDMDAAAYNREDRCEYTYNSAGFVTQQKIYNKATDAIFETMDFVLVKP